MWFRGVWTGQDSRVVPHFQRLQAIVVNLGRIACWGIVNTTREKFRRRLKWATREILVWNGCHIRFIRFIRSVK
jgi:hypothetical protein